MKELLYVLIMYTGSSYPSWTVSGVMTEQQCEQVKEAILAESVPITWRSKPVYMPRIMKCVPVDSE